MVSTRKKKTPKKVVEITSAPSPLSFEYPVHLKKLAEMFGWDVDWIREKCRGDAKRNPKPMPSHKPGKYRLFYPSEVNAWVKAA